MFAAFALAGIAAALPGAAAAAACGETLGADASRAESAHYVVAWRPEPATIAVSRHFALDLIVCPKSGARVPDALRVDATMPAHRHRMNYKASVNGKGGGRYRAEGLMFHMPGQWEFAFDVVSGDRVERVAGRFDLP
jgi:hypothetical protein